MARTYNLAVKYSTKKMVAKAYREYCAEASQQYATLMDVINDTISACEANSSSSADVVNSVLNDYASAGLTLNQNVTLGKGVVDLFSLLNSVARSTITQLQNVDSEGVAVIDPDVTTTDLDSNPISWKMSDLMAEFNANYHAIVVEEAVATSYDVGGSISEMITTARDVISGKFSSAYTDISNTLSNSIEKVRSGYSIVDYVSSRIQSSGLNDIIDGKINNLENGEDYSFTGASPITAISCMAAANKVIGAVGKAVVAVAKTVKTILTGILRVGKKVFGAIKKKLIEVTTNPYDIKAINGADGNNTVNGFYNLYTFSATQYPLLKEKLAAGPLHCDFIPCEIIMQSHPLESETPEFSDITTAFIAIGAYQGVSINATNGLLDGINAAYSKNFKNLFEATENITNLAISVGSTTMLDVLNEYRVSVMNAADKIDVLYRIKPIKHDYICSPNGENYVGELEVLNNGNPYYEYGLANFKTILDNIADGPDPYTSVDRNEVDLYKDFIAGYCLTFGLLAVLEYEALGLDMSTAVITHSFSWCKAIQSTGATSVTNADFFNINAKSTIKISDSSSVKIGLNAEHLARTIDNVFAYRAENPYDFSFWPYSRNNVSWFDSSFEIVSDGENAQAFTNFLTAAIVIVATIAIATTGLIKLKKARSKAQAQLMGAEWNLTDLASKGEDISGAMKAYKKAKLKDNMLSKLSSNLLVSGASGVSNIFDDNKEIATDLSSVISLIK